MEFQGQLIEFNIKNLKNKKQNFSPSHFIFNKALVEGLAARGHNITFVSPDVDKKPAPNVNFVHLEEVYSHYYK